MPARRRYADGEPRPAPSSPFSRASGRAALFGAGGRRPQADLIRAGFRSENALPVFYGLRIITTLVMLVLCIHAGAKMPPNPVMKWR